MNLFDFYLYTNLEDVLVLIFLYNFVKIVIVCLFNEILWSSQIFNKKHHNNDGSFKLRFYYESFLKLRTSSKNFIFFNTITK